MTTKTKSIKEWTTTPGWDTEPRTVELMVKSIKTMTAWENKTGDKAPLNWCPIVTKELFFDLCQRIIKLEKAGR